MSNLSLPLFNELLVMNVLPCRILRDRALYKVTSDFVDAAVNGAIGVIGRCIPPINPTDPECFHMLVLLEMVVILFYLYKSWFSKDISVILYLVSMWFSQPSLIICS